VWLSEGFATYLEQLWGERTRGDTARQAAMSKMRARILGDSDAISRPVVDTSTTDYFQLLGTNSYQKGAWVLHMLRRQVGDSAFFQAVRAYYRAHRHGTAETDDLRAMAESVGKQDLSWFFAQWLHRPGNPRLDVSWRYSPQRKRVTIVVTQPKDALFQVPLTVAIGGRTAQRVTVLIPAQQRTEIELSAHVAGRPSRIVLDPDVDLLAQLNLR